MTYGPTAWVDYGVPCIDAANLNNMEAGIDRAQGDVMNLRGLTAAIPASDPLLVGRLYFESDLLFRVWRDNGAGWDQVHNIAAGGAWTLIQEQILGAPAAAVTFAAIPGTYRMLAMILQARTALAATIDGLRWRANADAGNNYYGTMMWWTGVGHGVAGINAGTQTYAGRADGANSRANGLGGAICYWPGYAGAAHQKTSLMPIAGVFAALGGIATYSGSNQTGLWNNVAPITSLTILTNSGANLVAPSSFALYGIT